MGSITSSNAKLYLSVAGVFSTPVGLSRFAADDIFDTNEIAPTEAVMGVDGYLTAGKINVPTIQNIALMADSDSGQYFDQWAAAMKASGDVFYADATILLSAIGREFTMTRGTLTNYKQLPDARRVLQARRFQITWQSVSPALVGF